MEWRNNNRTRKQKKRNKEVDASIKRTYGKWVPVSDLFRSFFVWGGKRAFSWKENEIDQILKSKNLRFYREVSFDLLRRFDFYIPLLDLVIEYDGAQHFAGAEAMGKDAAKERMLERLGIKLIRYNKTHDLEKQISHDLIHHPVLRS